MEIIEFNSRDTERYGELKTQIKQGWLMFAQGILEVRQKKLYRLEYDTFEDFCQSELGITQQYATQTLRSAEVVSNLGSETMVSVLPSSERQARPLTKLTPEIQREAWNEVLESNAPEEITAKKVEEVVSNWTEANDFLKERMKEQATPSVFAQPVPMSEKEILEKAKEIRQARLEEKKEEQALIESQRKPLPKPKGVYELIYLDPPWRYDFAETANREIENHYPTMSHEDLLKLEIPADKDCVMFMWATAPKLIEAVKLLDSWGFEYKTQAIWDKQTIGMGYWFRGQHEILIVATKGNVSPPAPEFRISSVISEKKTRHSSKPKFLYDYFNKAFPTLTKIEMFARDKAEGFELWGNENL